MGRSAAVAVAVLVVLVLGGCSSGHKSSAAVTTTTTSTTTPAPTTTGASSSTASSSTTTTRPETTTTKQSGVRISDFTVSPPSPVSCNAPTQIELKWTASLATSVDLSIDGTQFATYKGGVQDHLEYFACDGKPHTYLLTARSGSAAVTASQLVTSTST